MSSQISNKNDSKNETKELDESKSKKEIRKKILEQMEFYFSDSNLTKDRFLKKEILNSSEGYIDLKIFLQFNKIRLITTDLKHIVKAVKKSEILELNENETMVKRRTPFVELTQKDIDKKTIYVENLQPDINSEEIKKYFEQFGKVTYISLPKFKTTNQLKGFAFIEFDEKQSSKNAVEFFKNQTQLDDLEPIGKFPKFNAQIIDLEKKIKKINDEIQSLEVKKNDEIETENKDKTDSAKRKQSINEIEEPNKKESKIKEEKNKRKNNEKSSQEDFFKNLRVVSKKNWLKSKELFLENQKKEVNQLKEKFNQLNKKLDELKNDILKQKTSKIKTDDIIKGCIIKVLLNLNNEKDYDLYKMSRQQLKEKHLKEYNDHIVYIDVEKNSNKILIRCKSPESAEFLLKDKNFLEGYQKSLLIGKEETDYFEKIYANRNKKQERKEKKQKFDKKDKADQNEEVVKIEKKLETKTFQKESDKNTEKKSSSKHITFDNESD